MNVNDNVYVVPFDKLDDWYKNKESRLYIPENHWRDLEGERGIVAEVCDNNIALVVFPTIAEYEGSSNPIMLYFYEDTLEKIPFGQEE